MKILFYSMALELCIDKNSCSLLLWRASRITLNLQKKKKFKISLALLKIQNNNKKYYFLKDAQYINFSTMREFASSLSCKSVNFRRIRSVQIRIFYFYLQLAKISMTLIGTSSSQSFCHSTNILDGTVNFCVCDFFPVSVDGSTFFSLPDGHAIFVLRS